MNKWICDCNAINPNGAFKCYNCGADYPVTKTSENATCGNLSTSEYTFKNIEKGLIYATYTFNYDPEYGELIVMYQRDKEKLIKQNKILTEALKKISADFGTDHCDGNTMIAKEALDKVGKL